MSLEDLRKHVQGEIFDYQMLMHHLREYKKPRDKVTLLLKNGSIIRVKKGIYVFGPLFQKKAISLELASSIIYSPSYISLEYALSYYGLIPERVHVITCISLLRSKTFRTPLGTFSYSKRPVSIYPLGLVSMQFAQEGCYLMASPEKALIDLISQMKEISIIEDMRDYLYENLRMEQSSLQQLNKQLLLKIIKAYKLTELWIQAIYD